MAEISGGKDQRCTSTALSPRDVAVGATAMFNPANEEVSQSRGGLGLQLPGNSRDAVSAAAGATSHMVMTNHRLLERLISEIEDMKSFLRMLEGNIAASSSLISTAQDRHTSSNVKQPTATNGLLSDIEQILHSIDVVDERITRLESKKYDESFKSYANGPSVLNLSGPEKFLLAQLRETKRVLASRLPSCV